jgi:hypothetical protein
MLYKEHFTIFFWDTYKTYKFFVVQNVGFFNFKTNGTYTNR